ncbi:hypothetical protein BaRGS_00011665 [Batillaria attramentaria]|uniref:Uncharacterized protein n=1 Tax=Batillaria attramentaria TaxID=370345 RepID=A0ABD0LCL6_9CAEN
MKLPSAFCKSSFVCAGQQRHTPDREVLKWGEVTISGYVTLTGESGFLDGLKGEGIPYSIIPRDDDLSYVKALACPDEEKVQIADVESHPWTETYRCCCHRTQDIGATYPRYVDPWCDVISRCNSQLVVVGDMHRTRRIEEYFHAAVTIT